MAKKQPKTNEKVSKVRENEKHKEDETKQNEDGEGSGQDGGHADADQDKALIQKMIDEHLGDHAKGLDKKEMEGLHALGSKALGAYKEMGKEDEAAYKCAGDAVALAHHLGKKQAEQESESEDEHESEDEGADDGKKVPPKKVPPKDDSGDDGDDDDDGDASEDEHESEDESESEDEKESDKKESKAVKALKDKLLEAEGRIVALEAKMKEGAVSGYVDSKLKESKQPVSVTKRFREAAGPFKSKEDFDSKWKVFIEGVKNASPDIDWGVMMEKATSTEEGRASASGKDLDFSDLA